MSLKKIVWYFTERQILYSIWRKKVSLNNQMVHEMSSSANCVSKLVDLSIIEKISSWERNEQFFSSSLELFCWKNISNDRWRKQSPQSKSPFSQATCRRTKAPTKYRKTNGTGSISIFSARVGTTIFLFSFLEINATQNTNFSCIRLER